MGGRKRQPSSPGKPPAFWAVVGGRRLGPVALPGSAPVALGRRQDRITTYGRAAVLVCDPCQPTDRGGTRTGSTAVEHQMGSCGGQWREDGWRRGSW
jgi:hypothetical protein